MAKRNYTDAAFEQIKRTIEDIDNSEVNPVLDFFGDIFLRIGQFLQVYKVDDYKDNIQKWYDKVLDSHNATIVEVENIFEAVIGVDCDHRDIMDQALEGIVDFNSTLNTLRDVISEKTSLADGKAAAKKYLDSGKESINSAFNKILTQMEKRVRVDSGKELVGDLLGVAGGLVGLCIPEVPIAKYAVKCKKFTDSFTALLGDLGAVTTGGLVWLTFDVIGLDRKNYLEFRYNQLMEAKNYKDTNSVSDWLGGMAEDLNADLADCPESSPLYPVVKGAAVISQATADAADVVDLAADAYDIVSDLKDSYDNIDEWVNGKKYTESEYGEMYEKLKNTEILDCYKEGKDWIYRLKVSPDEIIKKIASDKTGLPFSGWDDPDKRAGNIFKTAGTIWSYGEKLIPDADGYTKVHEIPDVAFDKLKDTKFLKDVFDFARDLDEFAHPESTGSAASGGNDVKLGMERIPLPGSDLGLGYVPSGVK